MTILLTNLLISMTIYVTVNAPPQRGFSFIEIWIIGMQVPTLVAVLESSIILFLQRTKFKNKDTDRVMTMDQENVDKSRWLKFGWFDLVTSAALSVYLIFFLAIFWSTAPSSASLK